MSSFSPTASAGRNTLNRFSPTSTQLNHGLSQHSTRLPADFYPKIDQVARNKKRSPNSSPTNIAQPFSTQRTSPTDLPFGNLRQPSSMNQEPTRTASNHAQTQVASKMYERVQHPIDYPMQASQQDRSFATNWDELISSEPHIARHSHLQSGIDAANRMVDSRSSNRSHMSNASNASNMSSMQQQEAYEWEGPHNETLETELWRTAPVAAGAGTELDVHVVHHGRSIKNYGDDSPALEDSFTKCYYQSNKMTSQAQEERRQRHLEIRQKASVALEKSRETSPIKLLPSTTVIRHNEAAGDTHGHSDADMVWSCGPDGVPVGFVVNTTSPTTSPTNQINTLHVRKDCKQNTGTYRAKEWGAGGGGKFEPMGDRMHHGNHAASSGAPQWMTSNREVRAPGTLIHHKDRTVSVCVLNSVVLFFCCWISNIDSFYFCC